MVCDGGLTQPPPARRPPRLDLGGAILEFGDLPERIERRIGEQIRRRLDERERNEHDAVRNRVVLARGELDRAAAGRDRAPGRRA